MQLTQEDIKHIADLSRLELKDEEIEIYRHQLVSILDYVEKLSKADVEQVIGLAVGSSEINVWRVDKTVVCENGEKQAAIDAFSRRQGSLLEVPAVFENRTE